jgi:hypothetical protein
MLETSSNEAIRLIGGDSASFFPELTFNLILSCDLCLDLLFLSLSDFEGAAGGSEFTTGFGKALEDVVTVNILLASFAFDCASVFSFEGLVLEANGSGVLCDMDLWYSYCGQLEKLNI